MKTLVSTAIRKVTRLGHPVLRAKARELAPKEILSVEIQRLIEEMAVTMFEYEGVGIAGNQVGQGLSIFLMGLDKGSPRCEEGIPLTVVCNPSVRYEGEPSVYDWEGCLSVPGLRGKVPRHEKLELSGLDHKGKPFKRLYQGFPARVVQHETDHLNGLVYLDRLPDLKTLAFVE